MNSAQGKTAANGQQNHHQNNNDNNNNKASTAAPKPSGGTVMFKRVAVPTTESELANLDLNVVSDVRKPHYTTIIFHISPLLYSSNKNLSTVP